MSNLIQNIYDYWAFVDKTLPNCCRLNPQLPRSKFADNSKEISKISGCDSSLPNIEENIYPYYDRNRGNNV